MVFENVATLSTYFMLLSFVMGAIIGSFLNVVIYRFHTGRSLSGHSHCLSCERRLTWYELFPLFSYLALRGRCRTCQSCIPPRYLVVELVTASIFLALFLAGGPVAVLFLQAVLMAILIVIAVYDINHFIIPNELVIMIGVVAAALFSYGFFQDGINIPVLVYSALAAAVAFAFYGGLWKISHGRWIGFGDAKLAIPLGFLVGIDGVFSMIVLSFWIGALVSVGLLCLQWIAKRGQKHLRFFGSELTIKSEVPFAPFLITGFILEYLYGVSVLSLISYLYVF